MERRVVAKKHIVYEGLFRIDELYKLIDKWLEEHDYGKVERSNVQQNTSRGKQVQLFLEPSKKVSDYVKHTIQIIMTLMDVQDTQAEVEGVKQNYQKGKADILFVAQLETDYEGTLEDKPFYFFTRVFYEKFIWKKYTKEAEEKLVSEIEQLYNEVKAYLNMSKFST